MIPFKSHSFIFTFMDGQCEIGTSLVVSELNSLCWFGLLHQQNAACDTDVVSTSLISKNIKVIWQRSTMKSVWILKQYCECMDIFFYLFWWNTLAPRNSRRMTGFLLIFNNTVHISKLLQEMWRKILAHFSEWHLTDSHVYFFTASHSCILLVLL